MRLLSSCLVVAGLLTTQIAAAAECARSIERPAFDVEELKSQLMVTAIACKANSDYNAFINRYRSDIVDNEKLINTYFSRNFGRHGQKEHDEYITSLANVQSQQSMKQGTGFCGERMSMFQEVMALPSAQDLSPYAQGKDLVMPAALTICTTEPSSHTSKHHSGHVRHGRVHHKHK